ncbi:hypothetical protein SAMN04488123_10260 [Natribacillus halophilus]|uniref:Uncharacterized protein n=1 Tax=Natribacillus halophilus TaxID=549003 RepID=A0A1G8KEP2_9BACI|nr:hypothetical protein SAMN04488123_10260 [Natribacillus halophilus]
MTKKKAVYTDKSVSSRQVKTYAQLKRDRKIENKKKIKNHNKNRAKIYS